MISYGVSERVVGVFLHALMSRGTSLPAKVVLKAQHGLNEAAAAFTDGATVEAVGLLVKGSSSICTLGCFCRKRPFEIQLGSFL